MRVFVARRADAHPDEIRERRERRSPTTLSAQAETLDERTVTRDVLALQVLQQTTAATDQQQQTAAAVVVVLVQLQVLGELADALAEQRDLHLGGTGIGLTLGVLTDDLLLCGGV